MENIIISVFGQDNFLWNRKKEYHGVLSAMSLCPGRLKLMRPLAKTFLSALLVSSFFLDVSWVLAEEKPSSPADPSVCGGPAKIACGPQLFCDFPEGSCGKEGSFGKCSGLPEICTMEFAPVCGCDDKTYGNACSARSKGISLKHQGECQVIPPAS